MSSAFNNFSNSDSIQPFISDNYSICIKSGATLTISCFQAFNFNEFHFLVIELNQVIHNEIVPVLENFNCTNDAADGVIENVGVLGPQVVEHVIGLCFFGEIDGAATKDHAVLIPQFAGQFAAFLIELKNPDLSGEPNWAAKGKFILEKLPEKNLSRYWLVLEDSLKNQSKLLQGQTS